MTSLDDQGSDDDRVGADSEPVDPTAVGEAAMSFMTDLAAAFGATATATLNVEGSELDVRLDGEDLGLLIGPGGRTLMAVQDLARVASQRRLGDHETRLRIDVAGYRERRRAALEKFAIAVADEVRTTGRTKALEPMVVRRPQDRARLDPRDRGRRQSLRRRGAAPPGRDHPGMTVSRYS